MARRPVPIRHRLVRQVRHRLPNGPRGAESWYSGESGMRRLPASLSHEAFLDVWKQSSDSSSSSPGAPGVDRVRAQSFASRLDDHVDRIRREIQQNKYRFEKLRIAPILKASGGYRIVAIPTVRDRLVQRALLRHLEADDRFKPVSPISYGFSKERTLTGAQRRAAHLRRDHPWVAQTDIIKFFDQIKRADVKNLLRKSVRSKVISELLCDAVDCLGRCDEFGVWGILARIFP